MSEDTSPASEVVKIDLPEAVRKLAVKDGVTDSAELNQVVGVKRYDQYAAQVRSYYAGYDEGYAAGIGMMGRPLARYMLRVSVVMVLLGTGLGALTMALVHRAQAPAAQVER